MKAILIALPDVDFQEIESVLEDNYILSTNLSTQEGIIDAIPKFNPDCIILHTELSGGRKFQDFYLFIQTNYPHIMVVVYDGDSDVIPQYIEGKKEIPMYSFAVDYLKSAPFVEETTQLESTPEANSSKGEVVSFKGKGEKIQPSNVDRDIQFWEKDESLIPLKQNDWEKASNASIDLFDYLQKIVVVTGASGGIGKTDLSINLAVHAALNGYKTVLLDLNLQNASVAFRLGLEYLRGKKLETAFELYLANQLNADAINDLLQEPRCAKGLQVLVGLEKKSNHLIEDMPEEFFKSILKRLKSHYDLIIIDTENNDRSPAYFSVIEIADHVFMPCTTHPSHLDELGEELHNWKNEYDIPVGNVDIVLNKHGEGGYISKDKIEKHVGREVIAVLPHSKEILRGAEREEPAVTRHSYEANVVKREMDKVLFRISGKRTKLKETLKPTMLHYRKKVRSFVERIASRN